MKTKSKMLLFASIVITTSIISCKKEKAIVSPTSNSETSYYSSAKEFLSKNATKNEIHTINGSTGGSFTTMQGTKVSIPANALHNKTGNPVTGNVTIEFKDIYKKSDMLFSDMPTQTYYGFPLKSAGEFFIKASVDGDAVLLNTGKKITIEQPAIDGLPDQAMDPFVFVDNDTVGQGGGGWWANPNDSIAYTTSSYVFSLYNFSNPADSGTWCNSDNSDYFNSYTLANLTLHPNDNTDTYGTDVFLVFSTVNSMVHVYQDYYGTDFPYLYAPIGLQCTVVAIGAKDGKIYSSFTPITITANQTVNFTLSETTDEAFKAQLNALN